MFKFGCYTSPTLFQALDEDDKMDHCFQQMVYLCSHYTRQEALTANLSDTLREVTILSHEQFFTSNAFKSSVADDKNPSVLLEYLVKLTRPRVPPHIMSITAFLASCIIIIITSLLHVNDKPGEDHLCHINTNVRGFLIFLQLWNTSLLTVI